MPRQVRHSRLRSKTRPHAAASSRVTAAAPLNRPGNSRDSYIALPIPVALRQLSTASNGVWQSACTAVCLLMRSGRSCLLALTCLWALCHPARAQISPGPLSQAHAGLEGTTRCTSCHSFGLGARKFRCTGCHSEIRERLSNKRGFHAAVVKSGAGDQDCARCHTEHLGPNFNIVKWEPSHDDFDHRQTGYALAGKHAGLACNRCHTAKNVSPAERKLIRVKDPAHTYLGVSPQCTTCHADEHRGQLDPDCARCHGFQSWKPAGGFDHEKTRYRLTGLHEKVACGGCHRTLTQEGKPYVQYKNFPFAACGSCHQDPHRGVFHGGCQDCHSTAGWKQVRTSSIFDHDRTQFPLHGAHAQVDCSRCHRTSNFKEPVPHARCADCHAPDPHKGQFPGQDCAACHNEDRWKPSLYTVERHQSSAYPLLGKHATVSCAKCHLAAGADTLYHVKHGACFDCHQDAHGRQFAAAPYFDSCQLCHTVDGFRPSTFTLARHQETRFHLAGGHAATACMECHKPPAGRYPPPPAQYKFATLACVGCHQDPHQGASAAPAKQGCEVCHSVRSWKEIGAFDHSATQFPLHGAHRAVACAGCHRPEGVGTARQIVFQGAPSACTGCHEDIHGGQFLKGAALTECTSCHNEASWKPSTFNHETRAKFSLRGAHQDVPCAQCHKETAEIGGRRVVIYNRAPSRCAACHADEPRDRPKKIAADRSNISGRGF
jgi:hypothetical protein